MQKDPMIYLNDIIFSIELIEKYTNNVSYSDFEESYDIQDKVMRRLEIIAEAAKKLPENVRQEHSDIPWKSIIGLRNIITHSYDEVNLEEVWEIIIKHLAKTKNSIEKIRTSLLD